SAEPKARLWDLATRQTIAEYNLPSGAELLFQRVALRPGPRRFPLPVQTNAVMIFDAETGKPLGTSMQMSAAVEWFTLSSDGERLAIATHAEVQAWNVQTGKPLFSPLPLSGSLASMDFSDDAHSLWCVTASSVWRLSCETGRSERELPIDVCS